MNKVPFVNGSCFQFPNIWLDFVPGEYASLPESISDSLFSRENFLKCLVSHKLHQTILIQLFAGIFPMPKMSLDLHFFFHWGKNLIGCLKHVSHVWPKKKDIVGKKQHLLKRLLFFVKYHHLHFRQCTMALWDIGYQVEPFWPMPQ